MKKMSYIDLLNNFYEVLMRSQVSKNGQLLYHTLLMINNKSSWSDWFQRTNVSLYAMMGITERSLIEARKELKELGIIDFVPAKCKGQVTKYSLLHCKILGTKDSTNDSLSDSQNAVKTTAKTTGETSDIIKTKTEKKTKTVKKNKNIKKFTPPSIAEVNAYCRERGNNVNAAAFVAHYASKGWCIGKTKMKNWKQAVITWEIRDRQERGERYDRHEGHSPADAGICEQLSEQASGFSGWD